MGKSTPPIEPTAAITIGFSSAHTGGADLSCQKKIKQERVEDHMYGAWSRQDFPSSRSPGTDKQFGLSGLLLVLEREREIVMSVFFRE